MKDRYRVEELADEAGISVELVRSYQSRGLLHAPRHEGRVAWYGQDHLDRLHEIRDLKRRGWTLKMVAEAGTSGPASSAHGVEAALAPPLTLAPSEVPPPRSGDQATVEKLDSEPMFTLGELARRCNVPPAVLRSFEASGVLRPRQFGADRRYTAADVVAVRSLLALIGTGVPMEEFMAVADVQLGAVREVATGAVDLFLRYVREPLLAEGLPPDKEAERMVASLRLMIHAASSLVTYSFARHVLNAAQEAIERDGSAAERSALAREAQRRRMELATGT